MKLVSKIIIISIILILFIGGFVFYSIKKSLEPPLELPKAYSRLA